jgi:hypothetical protein
MTIRQYRGNLISLCALLPEKFLVVFVITESELLRDFHKTVFHQNSASRHGDVELLFRWR